MTNAYWRLAMKLYGFGRKATLIEIRQLSLTAACKARHGVGATKVADRLG
jgi:hypothetical protein